MRALTLAFTSAALLMGVAGASPATAQGAACSETLSFTCLQRLGAGAITADDATCGAQMQAYRSCLSDAAAGPTPRRIDPAVEAEARMAFEAARQSRNLAMLDLVAQRFTGTFWAEAAAMEAAAIRGDRGVAPLPTPPAKDTLTAPPPSGLSLSALVEDIVGRKGEWVRDTGLKGPEPQAFFHHFVVVGAGANIDAGSIVRGVEWDGTDIPFFDVVYGRADDDGDCKSRVGRLSEMTYLGAELAPDHYRAADAIFERNGVNFQRLCGL